MCVHGIYFEVPKTMATVAAMAIWLYVTRNPTEKSVKTSRFSCVAWFQRNKFHNTQNNAMYNILQVAQHQMPMYTDQAENVDWIGMYRKGAMFLFLYIT